MAATYDHYKDALAALIQIPAQLNVGLALADEAFSSAKRVADGDLKRLQAQLVSLRRTSDSRYSAAVESLKEHNVLLPLKLRPEPAESGDEGAIRESVGALTRAVSAVDSAIKASVLSDAREKADAGSRALAGQQAALALKLRQDRIRQEHADAAAREAKAKANVELAAQGRKRKLILSLTVAALVVATIILVVALIDGGN